MRVPAALYQLIPLLVAVSCKGSLVGALPEDEVAGAGGALTSSIPVQRADNVGAGGTRAMQSNSMNERGSSPNLSGGGTGMLQGTVAVIHLGGSTTGQGGSGYAGDPVSTPAGDSLGGSHGTSSPETGGPEPAGNAFGGAGTGGDSAVMDSAGGFAVLPNPGGWGGAAGSIGQDGGGIGGESVGGTSAAVVTAEPGSAGASTSARTCRTPNRCPAVWITITNASLL